jgi:hypothetical protein
MAKLFTDKSGKIKTEVFFQMLGLHKIDLSTRDKAYLTKNYQNGDQIKYKEALIPMQIDLESAMQDEKKWTVQRPEDASKNNGDAASKITSKALSRLGAGGIGGLKSTTLS